MDFAAIGEALGMAKAIENANRNAQQWIDHSQRQVAIARAEKQALEEGRLAQIRTLRDALIEAVPDHPLLRETGLVHGGGQSEVVWHRSFQAAYDAVAIANQLPLASRAMPPSERARQAILDEPVTCRRVLFCRTWWWRGEQYRSERGAEQARARAADQAARLTQR